MSQLVSRLVLRRFASRVTAKAVSSSIQASRCFAPSSATALQGVINNNSSNSIFLPSTNTRGIKISAHFRQMREKQTREKFQAQEDEYQREIAKMLEMHKNGQTTETTEQGEQQSAATDQTTAQPPKLSKKQKAAERRNILLDLHSKSNAPELRVEILKNLASQNPEIDDLTTREYTHAYQAAIDIGPQLSWKAALDLFVAQVSRGVFVEPNTYRALTTLLELAQQWGPALSLLETWRRDFPTPVFNELGDKVRPNLPAHTPIDYATYTFQKHPTKSPNKGQRDAFEKYVELRRELKYSLAPVTYELYLERLVADGRNQEAVSFYFTLMNEIMVLPSAKVPEPTAPIDLYPYPPTPKDYFHVSLGTSLKVARAAEKIGNYAAALTIFRILRSRYLTVGVVPVRETVYPRIGTNARVALDEDLENTKARNEPGVGRKRDFLDLHNTHIPGILMVLQTYLNECRARRGYIASLQSKGAEQIPQSGTNWNALSDGVPAVLSYDPADTLEVLTDRTYSSGSTSHCGGRARKVCELLRKMPQPIKASVEVSPAGFDARVKITKDEILRWCEQTSK